MAKWTREQTTILLELYKQYPHLYNNRHISYSDRNERQNTLLIIARELEKFRPKTTIRDVKQKIRTIRTQYCVEKHKFYKSQSKDLYSPRLWCYDSLKFLDGVTHYDNTKPKHYLYYQCGTPSLDSPIQKGNDNNFESDQLNYLDTSASKKQDMELIEATSQNSELQTHIISDASEPILPTAHLVQKTAERLSNCSKSRNYAFGKFISEELESIQDKEILEDTKWDIQMTIRNALKQDRKRSHSICKAAFQSMNNRLILSPSPSQLSSAGCFNNTRVKHEMSEENV